MSDSESINNYSCKMRTSATPLKRGCSACINSVVGEVIAKTPINDSKTPKTCWSANTQHINQPMVDTLLATLQDDISIT
jgi:hypothetical protein